MPGYSFPRPALSDIHASSLPNRLFLVVTNKLSQLSSLLDCNSLPNSALLNLHQQPPPPLSQLLVSRTISTTSRYATLSLTPRRRATEPRTLFVNHSDFSHSKPVCNEPHGRDFAMTSAYSQKIDSSSRSSE